MVTAIKKKLTLAEFLAIPETQPAQEFINGEITYKPMPQGEHSRLQYILCLLINQILEIQKLAIAFPELRCVFGGATIVPDIAVFRWERIPRNEIGKVANRFEIYPDWAIEILSPDQSVTRVIQKLLLCIEHGSELGWLIDSKDESILVIDRDRRISQFRNHELLPVPEGFPLELTPEQIFSRLIL